MITIAITLVEIEQIATALETESQEQRARLERLCAAYIRILAVRESTIFEQRETVLADEDGHWDSSFPPGQDYKDYTGPALIQLAGRTTSDVATSGGFYYSWRRTTEYGGLYIGRDGQWWRSDETGTGRIGQYAAHPGNCDVDCEIDWSRVDADEVTTAELVDAESTLRALAFPLVAARLASFLSLPT
jgi:hypothetical protein